MNRRRGNNGLAGKAAAVLGAAMLLLYAAAPAYAATVDGSGPASGTAITAAMETVGYHAQAMMLVQLDEKLGWAAALIYLGVIFSAVLTVALGGSYKPALWMLCAPPIFAFCSGISFNGYTNRIAKNGAEWRFGAFNDYAGRKDMLLQVETAGQAGEVSWLFHQWNVLVSEISQRLIGIATNEDKKKQFLFMSRQKTMDDLFGAQIRDAHLQALTGYFMVHCTTEIGDARLIAVCNRDQEYNAMPDCAKARERYCDRFPKRDKPLTPGPWMDMVYELSKWNKADEELRTFTAEDYKTKLLHTDQLVSCAQLWRWVLMGSQLEVYSYLNAAQWKNFDWYAFKEYGGLLLRKVIRDIKEKMTDPDHVAEWRKNSEGDPCPPTGNADIPSLASGYGAEDFGSLVRVLMLRKLLTSSPSQEIWQRAAMGSDGIVPQESTAGDNRTDPRRKRDITERQKEADFAAARKYEVYALLHLLPYLQGFILYGLAATYPFFAMLILVPGRAHGFFTWMALWAWAKCWDVGWALIIVADEIIWELLPHKAYFNPNEQQLSTSPVTLLEAAFDMDPSYSLATYWMLLSVMITGVPIVSAQAVMGGKKAIAGTLLKGVSDMASRIGKFVSGYNATWQTTGWEQEIARRRMENTFNQSNFMHNYMMSMNKRAEAAGQGPTAGQTATASAAHPALEHGFDNPFDALSRGLSQHGQVPGLEAAAAKAQSDARAAGKSQQEVTAAGEAAKADALYAAWGEEIQRQVPFMNIFGENVKVSMAEMDPTGAVAHFFYGKNRAEATALAYQRQLDQMFEILGPMDQKERDPMMQKLMDTYSKGVAQVALDSNNYATRRDAALLATAISAKGTSQLWGTSAAGMRKAWIGVDSAAGFDRDKIQVNRHLNQLSSALAGNFNSLTKFNNFFIDGSIQAMLQGAETSLTRGGEFMAVQPLDTNLEPAFTDLDWKSDLYRQMLRERAGGESWRTFMRLSSPFFRR